VFFTWPAVIMCGPGSAVVEDCSIFVLKVGIVVGIGELEFVNCCLCLIA
jgi:hypothetical protein